MSDTKPNSYVLEGKVLVVGAKRSYSDKFSKNMIVVELDGKYPQQIKVEFINDKMDLAEGLSVGDHVKVKFVLSGNEYKENYYVNLRGIDLRVLASADPVPAGSVDSDDDLPF